MVRLETNKGGDQSDAKPHHFLNTLLGLQVDFGALLDLH